MHLSSKQFAYPISRTAVFSVIGHVLTVLLIVALGFLTPPHRKQEHIEKLPSAIIRAFREQPDPTPEPSAPEQTPVPTPVVEKPTPVITTPKPTAVPVQTPVPTPEPTETIVEPTKAPKTPTPVLTPKALPTPRSTEKPANTEKVKLTPPPTPEPTKTQMPKPTATATPVATPRPIITKIPTRAGTPTPTPAKITSTDTGMELNQDEIANLPQSYISSLESRLREHFVLSNSMRKHQLVIKYVRFKVYQDGTISDIAVIPDRGTRGFPLFDNVVIEAVKNANLLPFNAYEKNRKYITVTVGYRIGGE